MTKPRLRIGLIGTGFMGKCHAMAFGAVKAVFGDVPHVDRVALCDVDSSHTKLKASEFGFARATTNWRDLLAERLLAEGDNSAHLRLLEALLWFTPEAARQRPFLLGGRVPSAPLESA